MSLKERYYAWYNQHIVKGFYKAYSWLASLLGVVIAWGPDAANFVLEHIDLITGALPTLSPGAKAIILLSANLAVLLLRPVKQKNLPPPVGNTETTGA
jgi:hypothetical protein